MGGTVDKRVKGRTRGALSSTQEKERFTAHEKKKAVKKEAQINLGH